MSDKTDSLVLDGVTIAVNVVDTIVRLAAQDIEGVEVVSAPSIRKMANVRPVEVGTDAEGRLVVGVHVRVRYGTKIHEAAAAIKRAVSDAASTQIGLAPYAVDVYVDSLVFEK